MGCQPIIIWPILGLNTAFVWPHQLVPIITHPTTTRCNIRQTPGNCGTNIKIEPKDDICATSSSSDKVTLLHPTVPSLDIQGPTYIWNCVGEATMKQEDSEAECDVPVVGISHFLVVSEKFGSGKSLGIGIGKIWYRKKYRYRYRLKFWVPSHTAVK